MKTFSLKFLDIMVGIVLGLGFQWWVALKEPWQYIAFLFAYLDIVDYWIDYGPSLKRFPPKREVDILLDVSIMFALFLYIYTTQLSIVYFLGSFALLRVLDFFWLLSSKHEYHPKGVEGIFVDTWLKLDAIEAIATGALVFLASRGLMTSLTVLLVYIAIRVAIRAAASLRYKKLHV